MLIRAPSGGTGSCGARRVQARAREGGDGSKINSLRRVILTGTLASGLATLPLPQPNNGAGADAGAAQAASQPPKPDPPSPSASGGLCSNKGVAALRDPSVNRGCATTAATRQQYSLQGLLPPRQVTLDTEVARARAALALCSTDFERHRLLMSLKESNSAAFYSLLQGPDLEALIRILYTPTIGDACLNFGSLIPRPSCLYISASMAGGGVAEAVANWPNQGVRLAVVTDGERILGLGDLGCHGAGIPIGKCIVYAAAGLPPDWLLPVVVDVGTENRELLGDPLYVGLPQKRARGDAYYSLMEELVQALQRRFGPSTIVHWEDLAPPQAFSMLQRLRAADTPTFNDDIECTAAVTVAALLGALRLEGTVPLAQQRFLFFGAGQASLGTARLLVRLMQQNGIPEFVARNSIWMIDRRGLVTTARKDLSPEKAEFAQDPKGRLPLDLARSSAGTPPPLAAAPDPRAAASDAATLLQEVIGVVRPTALIGAAAVGGAFDQGVIAALVRSVYSQGGPGARPVVFALSNPTDRAEVSFEDAWSWSGGRVAYAAGTAFPGLSVSPDGSYSLLPPPAPWAPGGGAGGGDGGGGGGGGGGGAPSAGEGRRVLRPAQSNNGHVFPGLGLGCIATGATFVNDDMLLAAAQAIAGMVTPEELEVECVLPSIARLRDTTLAVAEAVAQVAFEDGLGSVTVDSARCLPALRAEADVASKTVSFNRQQPQAARDCVRRLQYIAASS